MNAEQVLLPTSNDVSWDIIELLDGMGDDDELTLVGLDFEDAFFQIPVLPDEQSFLVTYLDGQYLVFE